LRIAKRFFPLFLAVSFSVAQGFVGPANAPQTNQNLRVIEVTAAYYFGSMATPRNYYYWLSFRARVREGFDRLVRESEKQVPIAVAGKQDPAAARRNGLD
jgi:hypothetical protein